MRRKLVQTLNREQEGLSARETSEADRLAEAEETMKTATAELETIESAFDQKSAEAAEFDAKRKTLAVNIVSAERRLEKIGEQIRAFQDERDLIEPTPEQSVALEQAENKFKNADEAGVAAEAAFHRSEEDRAKAEEQELALRGPLRKAEQSLTEIDAEREALRKVLAANESEDWRPLIEMIDVDPGYENALAAALGDDFKRGD